MSREEITGGEGGMVTSAWTLAMTASEGGKGGRDGGYCSEPEGERAIACGDGRSTVAFMVCFLIVFGFSFL